MIRAYELTMTGVEVGLLLLAVIRFIQGDYAHAAALYGATVYCAVNRVAREQQR